jgi:hypothetical protein
MLDEIREENQTPGFDGDAPEGIDDSARVVDEAIRRLWAERPDVGHEVSSEMDHGSHASAAHQQTPRPVVAWMPLVLSTMLIIHASPLVDTLRDWRRRPLDEDSG